MDAVTDGKPLTVRGYRDNSFDPVRSEALALSLLVLAHIDGALDDGAETRIDGLGLHAALLAAGWRPPRPESSTASRPAIVEAADALGVQPEALAATIRDLMEWSS